MQNEFIDFLIKKKLENTIFGLGFAFAFIGYSLWKPIGEAFKLSEDMTYQVHFVCISISFFFYTLAYFLTKYDKWRWFPMFVTSICLGRVIQEMFYPVISQEYDFLEYFYFILTAFIVLFYYLKHQYEQFKLKKNEK